MVPKAITDTITALREERVPLAARLDAIDLAIDNLSRVYGLHGTPQPLPIERRRGEERRKPGRPKKVAAIGDAEPTGRSTEAIARRDLIVSLLDRSAHGMTAAELRKATPKISDKDRSNALSILRIAGKIKRTGNAWTVAARAA